MEGLVDGTVTVFVHAIYDANMRMRFAQIALVMFGSNSNHFADR